MEKRSEKRSGLLKVMLTDWLMPREIVMVKRMVRHLGWRLVKHLD